MYYQNNQYQNRPNYAPNYGVPMAQNTNQAIKNNQYHAGYAVPAGQQVQYVVAQPQYQNVQNIQNVNNPQTIYQNVPQKQYYHQQNNLQPQAYQNVQYIQKPVHTPAQQQVQLQPGQVIKNPPYNIQTNAIDGNKYPNVQIPTNNIANQVVPQNPNKNFTHDQTVHTNNQVVQQPGQKMIFNSPNPSAPGDKKLKNPNIAIPNNLGNQNEINKIQHHNNQNNQYQNITNTIAPVAVNNNPVEPKFQIQPGTKPGKTPSMMTIHSLAGLQYKDYPAAEFSDKPSRWISGYASNSYIGKKKRVGNEDEVKVIYNTPKLYNFGIKQYDVVISYFGIFDGHGGKTCSTYLKNNLDLILFRQPMFPHNVVDSVRETFKTAENEFRNMAVHGTNLIDKSGSCALIALIVNDALFTINLGDSRGLYSKDGGKEFRQLTRDHKPNDPIEQARIEKAGGKVYYANKVMFNGQEVTLDEKNYGGIKFPYRLQPSGLAVSFYLY